MNRSLLVISYYFPPLGMAGVQRPLGLAKYLHRLGWRVYVLTVKPISYWETDATLLKDFPREILIFRAGSLDPARVAYLMGRKKRTEAGINPSAEKLIWDTKLGSVPFLWAKGCRLIEKFSIAAVWTTSPPPSIHLTGWWLKRTNNIKWFADFRDPWEVEALKEDSNRWQRRQKRLKRLLAVADGATVVNKNLKEFLSTLGGANKVTTVFNGFDSEVINFNPNPSTKIFTLAHGGTLSPSTDPHVFLAAVSYWKKEKKRNFRLILVGRILGLPIEKRLAELGLTENMEIAGYLPHRAALEKLSGANLLLLFLSEDERYRLTIPAKLFEYIGLRKPVLAVASGEGATADFFSQYPVGALCGEKEEIIEKLEFYYQEWEKGSLPVFPESLRQPFRWNKQAERLSDFIESRLK